VTEDTDVVGKKDYELSFLIESEGLVSDVLRLVRQHQIEVVREGQLRKVNLAYKIRKAAQAFFGFIEVKALPSEVEPFEHDLETNQSILRHLIVKLPKERPAIPTETGRKPTIVPRPKTARPARPLSNVDLEKKLEEILQ